MYPETIAIQLFSTTLLEGMKRLGRSLKSSESWLPPEKKNRSAIV